MWNKIRAVVMSMMSGVMFVMAMQHIPHDEHTWWVVLDVSCFGFAVWSLAEAYNILIDKQEDE